ncbi:MAG: hypothetical protein ABR567_15840 [Myxococcales bacterium]|nr:hypothetical protein [Myxococcales bacterium]
MGARKLIFPIALAILWVVMAAMAMVDFAAFDATTKPSRPPVSMQKPLRTSMQAEGRTLRLVRG